MEKRQQLRDVKARIKRLRKAWIFLAIFALAVGISVIWEGPRMVYAHAVVICLDCIGLI